MEFEPEVAQIRKLGTQIIVRNEPWFGDKLNFLFSVLETCGGVARRMIVEPMRLRKAEPADEGFCAPTFTLTRDEALFLMDQLWEAGIRPTAGHGSAGQMAAVQHHLKDMRALVSKATGCEL